MALRCFLGLKLLFLPMQVVLNGETALRARPWRMQELPRC